MKISLTLVTFVSLVFTKALVATELEKYQKCYTQITNSYLAFNDSNLQRVQSGDLTAKDACLALLASAELAQNGQLVSENATSLSILATFHALHNQWFNQRDINITDLLGRSRFGVLNIYDTTSPASYYSLALLSPGTSFASVLQGNRFLTPTRTDTNPTEPHYRANIYQKDMTAFGSDLIYAAKGRITGYTFLNELKMDWAYAVEGERDAGTTDFARHFGGGVMGHPVYLMRATQNDLDVVDGAENIPRAFGRDVFSDFLCRDLPAVRPEDAIKYINTQSVSAFRTQASCIGCHASMDQATSAIKNLTLAVAGHYKEEGYLGSYYLMTNNISKKTDYSWKSEVDPDYQISEPKGRFLFRSYNGKLIDQEFYSIEGLAKVVAATEDFYICGAKRYFQFFTGIDANIADVNSNLLSDAEINARNFVIELGLELKRNQDPQEIIGAIIASEFYLNGRE